MLKDALAILALFAGLAFIMLAPAYIFGPSQMEVCLDYGYEWIDGDCVYGVGYDNQR